MLKIFDHIQYSNIGYLNFIKKIVKNCRKFEKNVQILFSSELAQIYPTTPMSEATSVEQLNSVTNRLFAPIIKRTRGLVNVRSLMMFLLELICIFDLIVNHVKR